MQLNVNNVGLTVAAVFGGIHALWAVIVAAGWAQFLVDLIFRLHFLKPVIVVAPFSITTAMLLVLVTTVLGYATGLAFGMVWNRLHR